jgi:hypothetical protein
MNWTQALKEIESPEFDVTLNVVSNMRAFFAAAAKEPAALTLYGTMRTSGEAREEVLGRIHDLSQLEVDRRYENPNDTALAILLWVTNFAAPEFVQMAADLVDRAPQCWYAKKLARRILVPPLVATGNSWSPTGLLSGDVVISMNPLTKGFTRLYHQRPRVVAFTAGPAGEGVGPRASAVFDLTIDSA